jgi:hypothetical protein
VQADQVDGALRQMSPEERALIELSLVRGVSNADIASLLGTEPRTVRERRDVALGELATAAGDGSDRGRAAAADHLRGRDRKADSGVATELDSDATAAVDEAEGSEAAAAQQPQGRRWATRLGLALLGGLVIAALVALVLALVGKGDDNGAGIGAAPPPKPARLEPLISGSATGTARVMTSGGTTRLRLSVRGLPAPPKGGYVIWLYNSVSDARALGGQLRGTFTTDTPLPAGYERFRFIDISREPADGNRNHSGQSVLRLSVSSLRQAK